MRDLIKRSISMKCRLHWSTAPSASTKQRLTTINRNCSTSSWFASIGNSNGKCVFAFVCCIDCRLRERLLPIRRMPSQIIFIYSHSLHRKCFQFNFSHSNFRCFDKQQSGSESNPSDAIYSNDTKHTKAQITIRTKKSVWIFIWCSMRVVDNVQRRVLRSHSTVALVFDFTWWRTEKVAIKSENSAAHRHNEASFNRKKRRQWMNEMNKQQSNNTTTTCNINRIKSNCELLGSRESICHFIRSYKQYRVHTSIALNAGFGCIGSGTFV